MRKILFSALALALVLGLAGAGTLAYFSDTETSSGNTFAAGTLDLKVDGQDDANVVHVTLSNMKAGDDSGYYKWVVRNAGTLPGKLSVTFSQMQNDENGVTEPEQAAESQPYASPDGELGQYLLPGVHPDEIPDAAKAYVTIIERNDQEGWCIYSVSEPVDTGGTIGWGPKGWSVPSQLYSVWQAGPPHPWGVPGLNNLGGQTYGTLGYLAGDVLNPGQEEAFFFRVKLESDLRRWDGTKWVDVNDNIIQSDSVTFNITFKLEQVH